jgi:hypothetical protein
VTFDPIEERDATIAALRADKAEFERWRDQWILTTDQQQTALARAEDRADAAESALRQVRELAERWRRQGIMRSYEATMRSACGEDVLDVLNGTWVGAADENAP